MSFTSTFSTKLCYTCPNQHFSFCKNLSCDSSGKCDLQTVRKLMFSAREFVYHQDNMNHELFVLRDGWVMLYRIAKDGKRQVFRSVLPGELFGFQQYLHISSSYSAITLLNSIVCKVPDITNLCSTHPELALSLASQMAYDMMLTEKYLTNIVQRSAREKIVFMMLELYHRMKQYQLNNGNSVHFPLKQEDIADSLGLTAIHVNRILRALKDEGLLVIHNHELTILDYTALCTILEPTI